MTRADRIRQMTTEELAWVISEDCWVFGRECRGRKCIECLVEWLNQEWKMTNSDRIRQMSDEELAIVFGEDCADRECPEQRESCRKCWLDWLKQEVQENG